MKNKIQYTVIKEKIFFITRCFFPACCHTHLIFRFLPPVLQKTSLICDSLFCSFLPL
ncbi:hypothetical protein CSB69_2498 [Morganella morganii]|nr:hypothetical protein CSB69_2498 [Morganella morganii]